MKKRKPEKTAGKVENDSGSEGFPCLDARGYQGLFVPSIYSAAVVG